MDNEKQNARKFYTAARKKLPAAEAERLSLRIAKNIFSLPGVRESDLVLVYYKTGSEVDTAILMELIISSGRGIALPYCRPDGSLGAGRIFSPRSDVAPGAMNIMEPLDRLKGNICADRIGAAVCPGAAFDANLTRLGRGGGHYDRFLRQITGKAFIVGCAFDCQISETPLPREEHDVAMDAVVTEKRAFPIGVCPAIKLADDSEGCVSYKDNYDRNRGGGNGAAP